MPSISQVILVLLILEAAVATTEESRSQRRVIDQDKENALSHSCIHDQIIEQRKRPGRKVYSVSAQIYVQPDVSKSVKRRGRALLGVSELPKWHTDVKLPIRIYLNYDAVGHSSDRDCRNVGDIVKASLFRNTKDYVCAVNSHLVLMLDFVSLFICFFCQLGEPAGASYSGAPSCNPQADPPIYGDCWYNCTLDDIAEEDKKLRLRKVCLTFILLYDVNQNLDRYSRIQVEVVLENFIDYFWGLMHCR